MVDEATIAEALMKTPEFVILEGNPNSLCYHKVKTKSDLVNLVQYLTLVTRKDPHEVNKVAFQSNGQFYYLIVEAIFNGNMTHCLTAISLYHYLSSNTTQLASLLNWEEAKDTIGIYYPFNDLVENLEEGLEVDYTFTNGNIYLSGIPNDLQRLLQLTRSEGFSSLLQKLK